MRCKTLGILVAVLLGGGLASAQVGYRPGYDPAKNRPAGIQDVPEAGWTDAVNGLRAALSGPAKVKYHERFTMHVLVQNVSNKPIKVTLPGLAIHPYFTPIDAPTATGGYSNSNYYQRWEIASGHEIAVPFPPKTIVREGVIYPTHAVQGRKPGLHKVAIGFGAATKDDWELVPGEKKGRKIVLREGEWTGYFKLKPHRIEILDEDVALEFLPPAELGKGLVLQPSTERPDLSEIYVPIESGVRINVDHRVDKQEHWLIDSASHSRPIYWGPISTEELKKTDLLKSLHARIADKIGEEYHRRDGVSEMAALSSLPTPLVEVLFDLIPVLNAHDTKKQTASMLRTARQLRNRRVELKESGLGESAEKALEVLAAGEPELPDPGRFELVAANDRPQDVPAAGWGPENAGLQAAAVMPNAIASGQEVEASLFIRNVSEKPVFMTVSKGGGFDYLSAVDEKGNEMKVDRTYNYPLGFSGALRRMIDPGVSGSLYWEGSLLKKIKLEAGAIYKVATKTTIRFTRPGKEPNPSPPRFGQSPPDPDTAWPSTIVSEPGPVKLSWKLHTANGQEFDKNSRGLHWPAKGGWTGILETPPAEVVLTE